MADTGRFAVQLTDRHRQTLWIGEPLAGVRYAVTDPNLRATFATRAQAIKAHRDLDDVVRAFVDAEIVELE